MPIKGLLFDKDGTLLDYDQTWAPLNRAAALHVSGGDAELANRMLAHAGQDPVTDRVRPGSHLAAGTAVEIATAFADIYPDHGLEDLPSLIDAIFHMELAEQSTPVQGLNAVIDMFVRRGMRLGVVTADSERGALISLTPFNILHQFDFICGYDSGPAPKPDPAPVHAFCAETGLKTGEIAVIGDNHHDMAMGKAAGAGLVVGVLTGTSGHDELSTLADVVLDSINDLEACLIDRNLIV